MHLLNPSTWQCLHAADATKTWTRVKPTCLRVQSTVKVQILHIPGVFRSRLSQDGFTSCSMRFNWCPTSAHAHTNTHSCMHTHTHTQRLQQWHQQRLSHTNLHYLYLILSLSLSLIGRNCFSSRCCTSVFCPPPPQRHAGSGLLTCQKKPDLVLSLSLYSRFSPVRSNIPRESIC